MAFKYLWHSRGISVKESTHSCFNASYFFTGTRGISSCPHFNMSSQTSLLTASPWPGRSLPPAARPPSADPAGGGRVPEGARSTFSRLCTSAHPGAISSFASADLGSSYTIQRILVPIIEKASVCSAASKYFKLGLFPCT